MAARLREIEQEEIGRGFGSTSEEALTYPQAHTLHIITFLDTPFWGQESMTMKFGA